jgi:hypothetical protein
MRRSIKLISVLTIVIVAFVFQISNGSAPRIEVDVPNPVDGCRYTGISGDFCVKGTKGILKCVNNLDTAAWNCIDTGIPPKE